MSVPIPRRGMAALAAAGALLLAGLTASEANAKTFYVCTKKNGSAPYASGWLAWRAYRASRVGSFPLVLRRSMKLWAPVFRAAELWRSTGRPHAEKSGTRLASGRTDLTNF